MVRGICHKARRSGQPRVWSKPVGKRIPPQPPLRSQASPGNSGGAVAPPPLEGGAGGIARYRPEEKLLYSINYLDYKRSR